MVFYWPAPGDMPSVNIFWWLMGAPTVGALLAVILAGGYIQWGRINVWSLAGLLPAVVVLPAYMLGAALGWYGQNSAVLAAALVGAPVAIAMACVRALGEEIGWHGFMWPLLRSRWRFWPSIVVLSVIWLVYHVPGILVGWYGDLAHLPAFALSLTGLTIFMGVITDRSRAVWPSVIAHGTWNALVAESFATSAPAFDGNSTLLGEFGWVAGITMFLFGVLTGIWHTRQDPDGTH